MIWILPYSYIFYIMISKATQDVPAQGMKKSNSEDISKMIADMNPKYNLILFFSFSIFQKSYKTNWYKIILQDKSL